MPITTTLSEIPKGTHCQDCHQKLGEFGFKSSLGDEGTPDALVRFRHYPECPTAEDLLKFRTDIGILEIRREKSINVDLS